jgi:ribosomal protein S18 acetylase RimI-like enzyme
VIELVAIGPDETMRRRREIEELWLEVWPQTSRERFDEILPRHTERDGFRCVVATDEAERLVGLAYGYRGAPGEWWRDAVAEAMGPALAERWLAPGHFEVVELLVRPDVRRHGIAKRLHAAVLEGLAGTTAVLSTQIDNEPALALYRACGWDVVVPKLRFTAGGESYCVLGLDLLPARIGARRGTGGDEWAR